MIDSRMAEDRLFWSAIAPIRDSEPFSRLKSTQHHNDSVYNHTLRVAWVAYRMAVKTGADVPAVLRGAMLHDFYFHDWREKAYLLNHGWTHPVIALQNAQSFFGPLSDKEANIISSHMWPFNFRCPPRYREALLVSLADKYVATGEVVVMFFNFFVRNGRKLFIKRHEI
jgi:uncharacterized protein